MHIMLVLLVCSLVKVTKNKTYQIEVNTFRRRVTGVGTLVVHQSSNVKLKNGAQGGV
jgi:hypothetical protein